MKKILSILCLFGLLSSVAVAHEEPHMDKIVLSSDNTLVLHGAITASSVSKLMQEASRMDSHLKSGYPLYLFIVTPGGSIQAGLELIEYLHSLNRPVNTVTSFAASMGFQIVQNLGTRYIMQYGVLMSHKARGQFNGEFGGGISQLDSRYQLWLRRINMLDKQTVSRTHGKQTLKSYRAAYTPELWLNGREAVVKGYADKVVGVKCDDSLKGSHLKILNLGLFRMKVLLANCPLISAPLDVVADIVTNKGTMDLDKFLEKNGTFGDKCGSMFSDGKTDVLCAKDKTLKFKTISNAIKKEKKYLTRNLRDHIVYSY